MPVLTKIGAPLLMALAGLARVSVCAAEPPAAPRVSTFASVDDLARQTQVIVTTLEEALASEQSYTEQKLNITRDSNTLAALALALALHDGDAPLKKSAAGVAKSAQQLARAKDLAAAQAGLAAIKAAWNGKQTEGVELTWNQKIGSLGQLMKQATFTNNRLRRGMRRFEQLADQNAADAATLAVIAQAASFDTHEVKDPAQFDKWYELCAQMRDAAGAAGMAIKAKDQKATEAALARVAQSCDQCHQTFRIEAKP